MRLFFFIPQHPIFFEFRVYHGSHLVAPPAPHGAEHRRTGADAMAEAAFSSPINPHKEKCISSSSTQTIATAR